MGHALRWAKAINAIPEEPRMNVRFKTFAGVAALGIGLAASTPAAAAPILMLMSVDISDSNGRAAQDCSGVFGKFGGKTADTICDVGHALDPKQNVSPIIAKENTSGLFEISAWFPTIDGAEFDIVFDANTTGSGSWTYSQGAGDPDVRFWVAKGGNDPFRLYWMVSDLELLLSGACWGGTYTIDCLNAAVAVKSGTWSTVDGQGLSHLSWYDTGGGPPLNVPEPGLLFLMGAGLLGLGMARRRKSA